ncbi:hypothetical protein [Xanthomonas arboricola]|uniref:hypothetical protein n=1 Tax=Xanthomonas arboricola TaxID=56448 RepID=UPI0012900610|nr:hypothetical protein [Xanthomonas arboricola]
MPAVQLCIPYVWKLCDRPEAWSVWAALLQAFLAGAAIYFALRLATSQERRAVGRRTDVILEQIQQAAIQAAQIKTFFLGLPGEEPIEEVYKTQIKVFSQFAQSLRSIPLENLADARLLAPVNNAASCCENIVDLLTPPIPKNGSNELREWFIALGEAQHELYACHARAFLVRSEFVTTPLKTRAKNLLRELQTTRIRKKLHAARPETDE